MQTPTSHRRETAVIPSDVPPMPPLAMAAIGVVGYGCTTAVKLAGAAPTLAQASLPGTPLTIETVAQVVFAVLGIWGMISQFRRSERSKDEDARRQGEFKDAMQRIEIHVREAKAELSLQRQEVKLHLSRQDDEIAAVKQAVTPPAAAEPTPTS